MPEPARPTATPSPDATATWPPATEPPPATPPPAIEAPDGRDSSRPLPTPPTQQPIIPEGLFFFLLVLLLLFTALLGYYLVRQDLRGR